MDEQLPETEFGHLSTRGRRTGRTHTIEIWYALHDGGFWLISGGGERSDWVRNLHADPRVTFRIGDRAFAATAEVVAEQDLAVAPRRLLAAKYQGWREGEPLSAWAERGLVVAVTPEERPGA